MRYDKAIVVLTNGMMRAPERKIGWKPDLAAHMRIAAGAKLYHDFMDSKSEKAALVVIAGGKINGANNPSLSSVLGDIAIRKYGINPRHIALEENSIDTTQNAEFTMGLLREREFFGDMTLITSRYHLPRSMDSFAHYGAIIENAVVAEDVLKDISPHHRRFVNAYNKDCGLIPIWARNLVLHLLLLTRGPKFLQQLARRELEKKGERYVPTK
ncbi:MAG: YdcF family protein [Nanoarchaeota archaeon]